MSTNKITAVYVRRSKEDSGREGPDYDVYEFEKIVDSNGKKYDDMWMKETKLMQAVPFETGKSYDITLSGSPSPNVVNLPYPIEICWNNGKVYIKDGNKIIRVNENNEEENLSVFQRRRFKIDKKQRR